MLDVLLGVLPKKAESVVDLVLGAGVRPRVALLFYKKEKKERKNVCVVCIKRWRVLIAIRCWR